MGAARRMPWRVAVYLWETGDKRVLPLMHTLAKFFNGQKQARSSGPSRLGKACQSLQTSFFCIMKSGTHGIAPGAVRAGRAREASLCSPHGSAHPDLDSCHSTRAGPLRPRLLVSPSAPPPAAALAA